ncbi:hypothetical protein ParKJ_21975 [Paraburkholderia fungorum]|uniref:Uncharacterized protein n=1 Tax=Paraburkholderia fungorum TaxID=134537 RepID=A0AAP5QAV7_9BURK|nr:hypothetical protein [Paraburkholderia fungorum]MDT8840096.1 hypothetical protein [Paraburkholderia fungorum]
MRNGYHAAVRQLMSPVLPDEYADFVKARLGQCSVSTQRLVLALPFGNGNGNGDVGRVHLCQEKQKELGIEDEACAKPRRCRFFSDTSNSTGVT